MKNGLAPERRLARVRGEPRARVEVLVGQQIEVLHIAHERGELARRERRAAELGRDHAVRELRERSGATVVAIRTGEARAAERRDVDGIRDAVVRAAAEKARGEIDVARS